MNKLGYLLPLIPFSATLGLLLAISGSSPLYLLILFIFLLVCFSNPSLFKEKLLFILISFLFYYLVGVQFTNQITTSYKAGNQTLYGQIHTVPIIDGDSLSFRLKTDRSEIIQIHAFLHDQSEQINMKQLTPGEVCKIEGSLSEPMPPTNFGQFHYQNHLKFNGINWIMRPERGKINCISKSDSLYYGLQKWRHKQMQRIEKDVDPDYQGLMNALLFGDRTLMEEDLLKAYQRLGIIHLLAVSGLHVGMIVSLLFYLFIRVGITRERTIEVLLCILPIYVVIAGGAPSVIRASIMSMVVLLCMRMKMKLSPLNGIVIVYLGYLIYQPFALFQLGFQLSFLVSFGLIISSHIIRKYTILGQLWAVTFLSQLLSFPIILFHMFEISWISLPLNMVFIPFITTIVLPLTLLSFFCSFILPLTVNIPLLFLEFIYPFINTILLKMANLKFSTFIVGKPSLFLVLMFYNIIVFAFVCWERGGRRWWKWPGVLIGLLFAYQIMHPYLDPTAKVTMIDVGQGDSFLIELPYRKAVYLIDTGGTMSFINEEWRQSRKPFEVGQDVLVPTLKEKGIRKIDRLILTHGHLDHIGGSFALLKKVAVNKVYYGQGVVEGDIELQLLTEFQRNGVDIQLIGEGKSWREAGANFVILSPKGNENSLNNRSIVLLAEIEGISFLFSGDLEEEGEQRLLQDYPNLQVDFLKAGHHGSRTSTTEAFLDRVNPKWVLISAGRRNRFGHPHPEVITRLEEKDIPIFRTDQQGAVEFRLKERTVTVRKVLK